MSTNVGRPPALDNEAQDDMVLPQTILPAVPMDTDDALPRTTLRKGKFCGRLMQMNLKHLYHPLRIPSTAPPLKIFDLNFAHSLSHEYCVVIEDLPEYQVHPFITPSYRRSLDFSLVDFLLTSYGLDSNVVNVFRMGVFSPIKPRPLKIVFSSRHAVSNLVSSFKRFGKSCLPILFSLILIRKSDPSRSSYSLTKNPNFSINSPFLQPAPLHKPSNKILPSTSVPNNSSPNPSHNTSFFSANFPPTPSKISTPLLTPARRSGRWSSMFRSKLSSKTPLSPIILRLRREGSSFRPSQPISKKPKISLNSSL